MKILIVDDERRARETIHEMLRLYTEGYTEIREADGVQTALELIRTYAPDVVLLDIQLKDGNGFDVLNKIGTPDFSIIFITAFEEYAIKACRVSALDYLLKPVSPDELQEAMEKARKKVDKEKWGERLDAFIQNMQSNNRELKKIILKTADSLHVVNMADIVYCEADRNYTTFHLVNLRQIVVSKTLGDYEEMIGSNRFIRTHNSFLVNMDHATRYEKGEGGFIVTTTGNSIPVSIRRKDQVMHYMQNL